MEDPRKIALKRGIAQLTDEQIQRTLDYDREMALDHGNYIEGKFCPLAVGAGLDLVAWRKPPTDEAVSSLLHILGYKVNNTRGVEGTFFRTERLRDYREAALEVMAEREQQLDAYNKTLQRG